MKYFHKTYAAWEFVIACSWKILLQFVYKPCEFSVAGFVHNSKFLVSSGQKVIFGAVAPAGG